MLQFLKKRIESLLGGENFPFGSSLGFLDKGMKNPDAMRTFNNVKHSAGNAGRWNSYFRNPSCNQRHWANVRHAHRLTLLKFCKDIPQVLPDAICPAMDCLSCWVRNQDLESRGFSHFVSRIGIVPLKGHTVKFACDQRLSPSALYLRPGAFFPIIGMRSSICAIQKPQTLKNGLRTCYLLLSSNRK